MLTLSLALVSTLVAGQSFVEDVIDAPPPPKRWAESEFTITLPSGVKVAELEKKDDCTRRSMAGDTVFVAHAGYEWDENANTLGGLIDQSQEGDPLVVFLGSSGIIKGMEEGMYDMCVGEKRLIVMPPETAFDDPDRTFTKKPVPDGTWVAYEIAMTDFEPLPGFARAIWKASKTFWTFAPFFSLAALGSVGFFFYNTFNKITSEKEKAQKKKSTKSDKAKAKKKQK